MTLRAALLATTLCFGLVASGTIRSRRAVCGSQAAAPPRRTLQILDLTHDLQCARPPYLPTVRRDTVDGVEQLAHGGEQGHPKSAAEPCVAEGHRAIEPEDATDGRRELRGGSESLELARGFRGRSGAGASAAAGASSGRAS